MTNIYLNHDLPFSEQRSHVFKGDLLLYSCTPSAAALADHAITMITKAFESFEPQKAQFNLPVESFVQRVGPLKSGFTNDLRTKKLIQTILEASCDDLDDLYFDVPRLRVVPHGDYLSSGVSYAYKPHRDTWYSSPTSQVNWWMPVFPVTADRAMAFYPEYWERSVLNSSSSFDYGEWCRVGRNMAIDQIKEDTRKHPVPLEDVDLSSELRIAGTKGDVILFSASHLHATAQNSSGLTRFSIDFRTINLSDIENKRGSPLLDSRATGSTLGDFFRASDLKPLAFTHKTHPSELGTEK